MQKIVKPVKDTIKLQREALVVSGIMNNPLFARVWIAFLNFFSFYFKVPHSLRHLLAEPARTVPEKMKILHFIGTLGAGGAERQFSNFVSAVKRLGNSENRVLTYCPLEGNNAHYLSKLTSAGIGVSALDFSTPHRSHPDIDKLQFMLRTKVRGIYDDILKNPPDVFHAWLDYTNIFGALAALIADVPVIILSTRSVSPCHFPYFFKPWFKSYYRFLAKSPRVRFINNSTNGGKDYAEWLGIPFERFKIILNGIDLEEMKRPPHEQVEEFRKSLGITPDTIILCSIFRQTAEKRPEMFFRIAEAILKKYKNVCVLHAGGGPLQRRLENKIKKAGHQNRFKLLGRREDVPLILSASDIFLLTSKIEGTPNVILEAGCFGCCAVSTAAGGVPDCIEHGKTGFVHQLNDETGLIESISKLIENESLRKKISKTAQKFIKQRFDLKKMLDETLELYGK